MIDIKMDEEDWAKLTVSLCADIQKWSDSVCEDVELGWWYDEVVYDMAKAAISILKASTKAQLFYEKELKDN